MKAKLLAMIFLSATLPVQAGVFSVVAEKQPEHQKAGAMLAADRAGLAPPTIISQDDAVTDLVMVSGRGVRVSAGGKAVHHGVRPRHPEVIESDVGKKNTWKFWGDDEPGMTIGDAVTSFIPGDFQVFVNNEQIMERQAAPVDGEHEWDEALTQSLFSGRRNSDLNALIDWDKKTVVLRADKIVATEKIEVSGASLDVTKTSPDEVPEGGVSILRPAVPKPASFDIDEQDGFLSVSLRRWCLDAGQAVCQKVRWDAEDEIVIEAGAAQLGDSFMASVDNVFASLSDSISGKRFHYRMYPNGILLITD